MEKKLYLTALRACPGIGNKTLNDLLSFFSNPKDAWHSLSKYFDELAWTPKQRESFLTYQKTVSLKKIQSTLEMRHIDVISYDDQNYPQILREIYNPPAVLFIKGSLDLSNLSIAIVGSRRPTPYGKVIAEKLAEELAASQVTVISGMARGIDSYAHKGALLKGITVAVLGCGLDIIYPRENAVLMNQIASQGAVISEFPPGTPPDARHFPARNRIISGLSQGILVVEAAERSGSLITADFALEQGRDVFAIPGPITSANSAGCNALIKNGAKLVSRVSDILEEYNLQPEHNTHSQAAVSKEEAAVLSVLNYQPAHIEEILLKSKLDIGKLSKILTLLEIKKDIRQLPGQYYVLDKVNLG